jgi:signal transduction histidine kinase
VLIAVVCLLVVGILDLVIFGRLTAQADQRLATALKAAATAPGISAEIPLAGEPGKVDDPPVLFWKVSTGGQAAPLTPGAPTLPARRWPAGRPVTASFGAGRFRLEASQQRSGWLVAGQSLAGPDRVHDTLLLAEAVAAPFILLASYLGSLAIGLRAAAPVERMRRRQLEFTADASHELRTPVSVIEAEAELALSSPRSPALYQASLGQVAHESRRLHRIIEDLLWLARFDSEPPPPGEEPVDLALLAARCAERFQPIADARGIRLSLRHEAAVPVLVNAPPEWLDRLLGVLVDNACRYTPAGGTVTITAQAAGTQARLVVEDDGPGIPEHERERLFDRFHRASAQPGGAGLGLAIADAVVRSTGGRWLIAGSPSRGARMEVSWHLPGRPDPRPADRPPASSMRRSPELTPARLATRALTLEARAGTWARPAGGRRSASARAPDEPARDHGASDGPGQEGNGSPGQPRQGDPEVG